MQQIGKNKVVVAIRRRRRAQTREHPVEVATCSAKGLKTAAGTERVNMSHTC
jgi:hypothetical protein